MPTGHWPDRARTDAAQAHVKHIRGATMNDATMARLPRGVRGYIEKRRRRGIGPLGRWKGTDRG